MWPFTSSTSKQDPSASDLEKELPDSLKGVFQRENPTHKEGEYIQALEHNKLIQKKVEEGKKQPYDHKFAELKKNEDIKQVTYINCAELQKNVMTCLKNWSATDLTFCDKEIKLNAACTDIQTQALKRLHYQDCVSITHCKQIRYIVDEIFIKSFGSLGENYNDESVQDFFHQVDSSFTKLWK